MLNAKLTSISDEKAIVSFEDGQQLTIPISAIEGTPKEGQECAVIIAALGTEDAGRQRIAQHLLNELLKA